MQIATWLRSLGLEQYGPAFRDNDIDAEIVLRLTGEDLKDLGVASVGHRRKLLDAIAELNGARDLPDQSSDNGTRDSPRPDKSDRPVQPEAERRQLTILFCDLVGSTALSGCLDAEDYRGIIAGFQQACATTIARFDGFLAKYMGDGVLAYFGYPQAHEDEASRAVRAGLALVEEVARLAVPEGVHPLQARVGMATGLVVVGDLIGTGSAQEQSVAGETPNLAARLQSAAPPGGVVIAHSTRRLLGSEFNLEDLGPQNLRGFAEPVVSWRVLGTRAVESRFEARGTGSTLLIGRTEELGILTRSFEQARDGEGQGVLVTGEPGIGKSRLVRGLLDSVQTGTSAVHYQCSPFSSNSPLHPFVEQIERDAGFRNDDSPEQRLTKLETILAPTTDAPAAVFPLFAAMLSIPTGERYPPSSYDPEQQRELTVEALIRSLINRARLQPMLVLLEDLHWADPTTLELLDRLIDRIASERMLVVITFRPEFEAKRYSRPHVSLISLNRLARRQTTELAKGIAGGAELPEEVFRQILDKTDGVPLFVEEFTRAVLESGFQIETASGSRDGRLPFTIPATLHDSLTARLDRLPTAKAAAQQAAVIGREFTSRMLAAISPQSEPELMQALQQLVSFELVSIRGAPPDATYIFKHALLRDAAYDSLLRTRRQDLHSQIARILERDHPDVTARQPELVAHHLSEAGLTERAIQFWQLAADGAARRHAHQEAIAHCTRGISLLTSIDRQDQRDGLELRLQVRLGNSSVSANGWWAPEVGKALYRARDLCAKTRDSRLLHPVLAGLFVFHVSNPDADLATAERFGLELLSLGEELKDRVLQVDGHRALTNACYKMGKFEEAQTHLARGKSLYEESPWPEVTIEHLEDPGPHMLIHGACALWALGYPDRAKQEAAEAIAIGNRSGHRLSFAHAVYMAGHLSELMDEWKDVQKANDETIILAKKWGLSGFEAAVAKRERLVAVALHGDPEQMDYKRQHPHPSWARPLHDGVLARAFGCKGFPDEGLQIIESSFAWVDQTNSRFFDAELHRIRAGLLLLKGQPTEAELSFKSAMHLARDQNARLWELKAASDLARMLRDQGRAAGAHEVLAPINSWFTEGFSFPELQGARALLATLSP